MKSSPFSTDGAAITLHASCVSYQGNGVIILGASGTGKSSLALQLMAYGAELVADDQTTVTVRNGLLSASSPSILKGLIEARGVGLLRANHLPETEVGLVVDLDRLETKRLPELHRTNLAGIDVVCLHKADCPHFPAAILHYLRSGRWKP
ncbi:HPr kinase/phosphorylase [Roseobacter fucihabitans]|uniref:HPr kinase/phosphorylase n=1 Tax=Roseobacter fucihabitans TaxID=1537242 RepID=A0ABZ2BQ11_9RHOB|nr:HPr kinase/phosphatase C-terminal domain-containing protein [Roseobacter litoralis]MBC6964667.1 HPr kinase/phosphorylase [Roseobacter litoralis]